MKKFYDKILFAVALLLLAGSLAYYFVGSPSGPAGSALGSKPTGPAYESVPAPEQTQAGSTDWPEVTPVDENPNRVYQVFTPPKIYWDPVAGVLTWDAPYINGGPKKPPFGLILTSVNRELFRIQFEAYFESDDGNFDHAIVQFFNHENRETIRGSVGDKFPAQDFEIVSFKVERKVIEREGSTEIFRYPTVVINDTRSGEQLTLTTAERLYVPDQFEVNMATTKPYPPETFTWTQVGDKKRFDDAEFTLVEFNFDNQSATVEKTPFATEDGTTPEPETKILYPVKTTPEPKPEEKTQPSTSKSDSAVAEGFESFFN
ncbi:hypothetical protein [Ruficoccus sp. ZRK36]|uniref:hypothetical protein n=1 Tax=Ruficoccus sp. ZRK36 TaxID=2866311 RepID=UPI001C730F8B|nr:hypothetical protein [Ruficoccus sp. ZRK36]QYY36532.1 hypothetical protein K0V07_03450 [Ruficoccus sp. ZRK36]